MATKGTRYTPGAFEARIYSIGQLRCVDIPRSISDAFGASARVPVRVRIGRLEGQSSLVPKRDGGHRLYIAAGLRRMPPLDSGDRVRIKIWRDPRGGEPVLPDDLIAAFRRVSGGMAALLSRSPADRRQLVRWIEAPRSPEARRHRIEKAIDLVFRERPKKTVRRKRA